jgi:hypothetical protein
MKIIIHVETNDMRVEFRSMYEYLHGECISNHSVKVYIEDRIENKK